MTALLGAFDAPYGEWQKAEIDYKSAESEFPRSPTSQHTSSPLENFPETPKILLLFITLTCDNEGGGDDDNDQIGSIDATTGSGNRIPNTVDVRQSDPSFPPSRKLHLARISAAPHTGFLGVSTALAIRNPPHLENTVFPLSLPISTPQTRTPLTPSTSSVHTDLAPPPRATTPVTHTTMDPQQQADNDALASAVAASAHQLGLGPLHGHDHSDDGHHQPHHFHHALQQPDFSQGHHHKDGEGHHDQGMDVHALDIPTVDEGHHHVMEHHQSELDLGLGSIGTPGEMQGFDTGEMDQTPAEVYSGRPPSIRKGE